jgi:hypothetical protein
MQANYFKEKKMKKILLFLLLLPLLIILAISGCSSRMTPAAPSVLSNTSTYTSTPTMTPVTSAFTATSTSTLTLTSTNTPITPVITATSTPGYPFVRSWGKGERCTGTNDPDIFLTPCGMAVNSTDFLYIADLGNNRIVKYDPSGTQVAAWGSGGAACSDPGTGDGQFNSPLVSQLTLPTTYISLIPTTRGYRNLTLP